jgi:hypothetical protein
MSQPEIVCNLERLLGYGHLYGMLEGIVLLSLIDQSVEEIFQVQLQKKKNIV